MTEEFAVAKTSVFAPKPPLEVHFRPANVSQQHYSASY